MTDPMLRPLLEAVAADDDERAEIAIIELCRQDGGALSPLLELAKVQDQDQRWWALRGLAALAAKDEASREAAMPALLDALADDDDAIRCVAALALGEMQAGCAIPSLVLLLSDQSGWVRSAAADGLALIGEPAVPALGEALQDDRDGVRVRAAYALHKIQSKKAARWLFPALNDPNHIVHTYAYETLDQMGMLTTLLVQ